MQEDLTTGDFRHHHNNEIGSNSDIFLLLMSLQTSKQGQVLDLQAALVASKRICINNFISEMNLAPGNQPSPVLRNIRKNTLRAFNILAA